MHSPSPFSSSIENWAAWTRVNMSQAASLGAARVCTRKGTVIYNDMVRLLGDERVIAAPETAEIVQCEHRWAAQQLRSRRYA